MGKILIDYGIHKTIRDTLPIRSIYGGGDVKLPNVSYCVQENECHMTPYVPPMVIEAAYLQDSSMEPKQLYHYHKCSQQEIQWGCEDIIGANMFDKIEIDGVEVNIESIDTNEGLYTFSTEGAHEVKYTLKNGVVGVSESMFMDSNFVSINLPNGLISIGDYAFDHCSGLSSITIPNSVTSIGEFAFSHSRGLTSITIPSGITTLEVETFRDCYGLKNVTFAEGTQLTSIGDMAFDSCTSLSSITIPASITYIEPAFQYCTNLSNVTCLAITPPTLDYGAFDGNASGRKIYVPSSSVNSYKSATNWSDYASDIEPIPNS